MKRIILLVAIVLLAGIGFARGGTGTLIITSQTSWADVYVDEELAGQMRNSPGSLTIGNLEPGIHRIRIENFTGFDNWFTGSFTIAAGQTLKAQAEPGEFDFYSVTGGKPELTAPPAQASSRLEYKPLNFVNRGIIITSDPSHAKVIANGAEVGTTPFTYLNPNVGSFKIRLEAPSCEPWEGSIEVRKDYITTLDVTLARAGYGKPGIGPKPKLIPDERQGSGKLLVYVDQWGAEVLVDGSHEFYATSDDARNGHEIVLSPGEHTIKVVGDDEFKPYESTVNITGGKTTELRVNLEKPKGKPKHGHDN
jgi:hypothetical protein